MVAIIRHTPKVVRKLKRKVRTVVGDASVIMVYPNRLLRYYGVSEPFAVAKDQAKWIDLPCAIANAAVSVQTDEEIAFSAYQLTVQASDNTGRRLTFNASTKENTAYFNVAGSRTIQYTLTIGDHTLSQSFAIQPQHSYTLDVHKQTNEEITVSIGVTVDDAVDEDTTEETYNPYV